MPGAPATDVYVSRCQGIDDTSAAICMKELQVGGSELNCTWENLMCEVVLLLVMALKLPY